MTKMIKLSSIYDKKQQEATSVYGDVSHPSRPNEQLRTYAS